MKNGLVALFPWNEKSIQNEEEELLLEGQSRRVDNLHTLDTRMTLRKSLLLLIHRALAYRQLLTQAPTFYNCSSTSHYSYAGKLLLYTPSTFYAAQHTFVGPGPWSWNEVRHCTNEWLGFVNNVKINWSSSWQLTIYSAQDGIFLLVFWCHVS